MAKLGAITKSKIPRLRLALRVRLRVYHATLRMTLDKTATYSRKMIVSRREGTSPSPTTKILRYAQG